nr:MAG TPA: hypothetical protein [Caudoviricetes sp.]
MFSIEMSFVTVRLEKETIISPLLSIWYNCIWF